MTNCGFDFSMSVDLFLKHLKRNCYSIETSNGYEKDLICFRRFMSSEKEMQTFSVLDIDRGILLAFMDDGRKKGHKTNTIARRISTLKSFYKYLVYELDFPVDVAARIRVPKAYIPLPPILSEAKIKRLLTKAKDISLLYHLFFSMLYYTGSRLTPVRTLMINHLYLSEGLVYFPKVKGGKDLYLPIHHKVVKLLEQYLTPKFISTNKYVFPSNRIANQPVSPSDVRNKLRLAAMMAGIEERVTPHTLRHCTATHLTINNVEQRTIARILGHADLRSTMRYQHVSVDHLRRPINRL